MKNSRLSIIIPTFNERAKIVELTDFLISNACKKLPEIIIVNAKDSEDNIHNLNLPSLVKIVNSEETCRSNQLQYGADIAKGDVLYFLHADTLPPKNYIDHIFNLLDRYDFGMFSYQFDEQKWNLKFNGWMTQWKGFYTGGGDQGLFIKKEDFEKVNGFNKSLSIMEDYDLFWRLKKANFKYKIVRDSSNSICQKISQKFIF